MSTTTSNLQLTKPEVSDNLDPNIFADNFDKIDTAFTDLSKAVGDITSDVKDLLSQAEPNAIQVYISESINPIPQKTTKVYLGYTQTIIGSQLSAYNGGVKCLRKGTISIACGMVIGDGFEKDDLVHLSVYRNSSLISDAYHRMQTNGWEHFATSELLLNVSAGDVLYYYTYNQTYARGRLFKQQKATSMTVRYL